MEWLWHNKYTHGERQRTSDGCDELAARRPIQVRAKEKDGPKKSRGRRRRHSSKRPCRRYGERFIVFIYAICERTIDIWLAKSREKEDKKGKSMYSIASYSHSHSINNNNSLCLCARVWYHSNCCLLLCSLRTIRRLLDKQKASFCYRSEFVYYRFWFNSNVVTKWYRIATQSYAKARNSRNQREKAQSTLR